VIALLLWLLTADASVASPRPHLDAPSAAVAVAGTYWANEVPPAGAWWAICHDGSPSLKKVQARNVPLEDGSEFEELAVDGCSDVRALVRGVPGLSARPLVALQTSVVVQGAEVRWRGKTVYRGHSLESALVRWAGDLDGDGLADLILEVEEEGDLVLFLSRGRRPGQDVREVARLHSTGC
jgi:hypothetical protein